MSRSDMQHPTVFGVSALLHTPNGFAVIREQETNEAIGKEAGMLSFPTGFCAPGEHPEAAVIRELQEETGIIAEPVAIVGLYLINGAFGIAYEMRETGRDDSGGTDLDVGSVEFMSAELILKQTVRPAVRRLRSSESAGSQDRFFATRVRRQSPSERQRGKAGYPTHLATPG